MIDSDIIKRLEKLEIEIKKIKQRNLNVEADKAWEKSLTRRSVIAILTYIICSSLLFMIGIENFLSSALVPTVGYLLSTLSVPLVKQIWHKYR